MYARYPNRVKAERLTAFIMYILFLTLGGKISSRNHIASRGLKQVIFERGVRRVTERSLSLDPKSQLSEVIPRTPIVDIPNMY